MAAEDKQAQGWKPTYLQIRYLAELKKMQPPKRGLQVAIAEHCNVSTVAVNKCLKKAIDQGLITERFFFTEYGNEWIGFYGKLARRVDVYLREIGIPEPEREEHARKLVDEMDSCLLESILESHERQKRLSGNPHAGVDVEIGQELDEGERLPVRIAVYRMTRREYGESPFSMGNRAFRHEGEIVRENGKDFLILYTCEMQEKSRLDGKVRPGRINGLKYQYDCRLFRAEGLDEHPEYLRLPLEAFRMHVCPGGEIKGMLPVTVTCSAGNRHMPESTAVLMVWF